MGKVYQPHKRIAIGLHKLLYAESMGAATAPFSSWTEILAKAILAE